MSVRKSKQEKKGKKRHTEYIGELPLAAKTFSTTSFSNSSMPMKVQMTASWVEKNSMNRIIAAKRMMQQKKREYGSMQRVFVDSVQRLETKGYGEEAGRRRGRRG